MSCKCPAGMKATPVKVADVDVCLCNMKWTFNDGPGVAKWDDVEAANSIKHPGDDYTKVWFRCGKLIGGSEGFQSMPGWALDAAISWDAPDDSKALKTWQVGIIQTVESEIWKGYYEEDWGRKAMATKARDGDQSATAPWYAPAGADGEPIGLEDVPKDGMHPTFSDDPKASFFFVHPDAPCRKLQGASIQGTYHLWLIAIDPKAPLDDAHVKYLWHATVVVDKQWEIQYGQDPQLLSNWVGSGKQIKKDVGPGKGSKVPILTGAVANDSLNFVTDRTGKPCPAAAGGKKP